MQQKAVPLWRNNLSLVASIGTLVLAAFLFVQMIRFVKGDAAFWPIDWLNAAAPAVIQWATGSPNVSAPQAIASLDQAIDGGMIGLLGFFFYYAFGVVGYLWLCAAVMQAGAFVSEVIQLGWDGYREKEDEDAREERIKNGWRDAGTVKHIINHPVGGFFGVTWYTEIWTAHGNFIVKGKIEGSSARQGLAVSKNGYGEIRIGGLKATVHTLA